MQSTDQFTLLQGAGFHKCMLSFLEIDERGDVNVHYLPKRRHVTAGVGGFADITSSATEIIFLGSFTAGRRDIRFDDEGLFIEVDGPLAKLVRKVSQVTFSGQRALDRGARVVYITERCVLELTRDGLVVTEVAPGIDLKADVLARSEFDLGVSSDLKVMSSLLFRRQPLGLTLSPLADHPRFSDAELV
jgi:acyl CoA:acetate/3-ketoacid CoA transferase